MIRRSTWIVLAVFLALLVLAFLWEDIPALNPLQHTPTPLAEIAPLFDFAVSEVRQLAISDKQGNQAVYERDSDGLWHTDALPEASAGELDSVAIAQIVGQLANWRPLSNIDAINELEAIGLVNPEVSISVTLTDGDVLQVGIGDAAVTGSGYYVHSGSQPPQIVNISAVDQVVALLYSPPLMQETPTPAP